MRTYYVVFWDKKKGDYISLPIKRENICDAEKWGRNKSSTYFQFRSVSS